VTPVEGGPGRRRFFDAEKVGILFILGVVAMVALAGLAFALVGPLAGFLIIVAMVAGALTLGFRLDARGEVEVLRTADDGVKRLLVLAEEGLGDERLVRALNERADGETHVHVVVPALADRADRLASDVDGPRLSAGEDLDRLLGELGGSFAAVDGSVGDSDPRLALEDALRTFPADEVVLVNPPEEERGRLERSATQRAKDDVPLRVTELNLG